MVNLLRKKNPGEAHAALPDFRDVRDSKWNRKRILGNVAAVVALSGITLGLGTADTNDKIEQTAEPEITHVTDGLTGEMPGFVPVEGEDRYKLLVDTQPIVVVPQNFAPNFEIQHLSDSERDNLVGQLQNEAAFLRANENAITTIKVHGFASDESGFDSVNGDGNLGKSSENNRKLAEQRRDVAYEQSLAFMQEFGDRVNVVKAEAKEVLLTEQDVAWATEVAGIRGMSLSQFTYAYQNNRAALGLTTSEADMLFNLIDKNRGAGIVSERNVTGIDPASEAVVLQQVAPTLENESRPEMKAGNTFNAQPIAAAVMAAAGLALSVRRRIKSKKDAKEEHVSEQLPISKVNVNQNPLDGVVVDPLAKKIDWVMERGRSFHEPLKDKYFYVGKHRQVKIGKKAAAVTAALAAVGGVLGGTMNVQEQTIAQINVVGNEPAYPFDYSKADYIKRTTIGNKLVEKLGKPFGLGRRYVYKETPVDNPYLPKPAPVQSNVYTFDMDGNLIV